MPSHKVNLSRWMRWIDNKSKVEVSRPSKVEVEGLGGSTW
jgi:hypothetical protein